jgi:rubrerythrin
MSGEPHEIGCIDVGGMSRAAFILRGAMATAAVSGAGAVAPFVSSALAQADAGDIDILNFALTLEHLEATFYARALEQVPGLDGRARAVTRQLRDDEAAHVKRLTTTIRRLGGRPAARPRVDFGDAFASVSSYLKLATTFEDTGVSAYNGAAPKIKSTDVLEAAGSIVQVEARHAALIRLRRGELPAPRPFDVASGSDEVLAAVDGFIEG